MISGLVESPVLFGRITVAMPIYNAGDFLRPAVLSIKSQTYTNWELLIIDDGSTDNALETISDLQDDRIKIISDGMNRGLAARLNEAIDMAEGEYFARMDQDDISYPERLRKQVEVLVEAPNIDLVCVRAIAISEDNEVVGYLPYQSSHLEIVAKPWLGFHMPHPTWMGRLDWFRKYRYSAERPYFCEDQELLLRAYQASKFACIPEILFAYRLRTRSSIKKLLLTRVAILKIQIGHFFSEQQSGYIFLAICSFGLKVLKDYLNVFLRVMYSPHKKSIVLAKDVSEFKEIKMMLEVNHV